MLVRCHQHGMYGQAHQHLQCQAANFSNYLVQIACYVGNFQRPSGLGTSHYVIYYGSGRCRLILVLSGGSAGNPEDAPSNPDGSTVGTEMYFHDNAHLIHQFLPQRVFNSSANYPVVCPLRLKFKPCCEGMIPLWQGCDMSLTLRSSSMPKASQRLSCPGCGQTYKVKDARLHALCVPASRAEEVTGT